MSVQVLRKLIVNMYSTVSEDTCQIYLSGYKKVFRMEDKTRQI